MAIFASASAIASAAGCISAQWNGADTGSSIARRAPFPLAISTARSTRPCRPNDNCLRRCRLPSDTLALRGLRGDRRSGIELKPDERRHRAGPDRHRGLHGAAANTQQARVSGRSARRQPRERNIPQASVPRRTRHPAEARPRLAFEHAHAASETAISGAAHSR